MINDNNVLIKGNVNQKDDENKNKIECGVNNEFNDQ